MRPSAPRLILVSLFSVGTFIAACGGDSSSPSIPNYTLDGSVAPPADGGADDASVIDEDAADAADAAPVICPDVFPDDATSIFVTTTGTNGAACGTRAAPCKTVTQGMLRAAATSKAQVDIAQGTYTEQVTLTAGLELVGGWSVTAGAWKRACTTPGQITILKAPATVTSTVLAPELGGEATLTLLRIESKAAASVLPGESIYGIFATGGTTILTLKDVNIDVVAAGAGTAPAKAADGTPAAGTCAAGTGVAGASGGAGPGAGAGAFGAGGYTPGVASGGGTGSVGNNGLAGGAGKCIQCGTCSGFLDVPACTMTNDAALTCGSNGSSGCGGNAGAAGAPGTGGGSSVGIYTWDAAVAITGGSVKSGDGGNGAAGGAGGAGGVGSAGLAGLASAACITACGASDGVAMCLANTMGKGAAGAIGGTGAIGGAGGVGGGGGGGSSYATYQGSAGVITVTGTSYAHGKAGAGGGAGTSAGAAGTSADHFP